MNVNNFLSELKKDGYQLNKPYLFDVWLSLPGAKSPTNFSLLCHQCNLPGWSAETTTNRIYGLNYEMVTGLSLDVFQASCYVDRNLKIVDYLTTQQKDMMFNKSNYSPKYRSTYIEGATVTVYIYDTSNIDGLYVGWFIMKNAFVKNVTSMNLDWALTNTAQSIQFTVAYEEIFSGMATGNAAPSEIGINMMNAVSGASSGMQFPVNFDTVRELIPESAKSFALGAKNAFGQLTSGVSNIFSNVTNTITSVAGEFTSKVGNVLTNGPKLVNGISDNLSKFSVPFPTSIAGGNNISTALNKSVSGAIISTSNFNFNEE